MEFIVAVLLFVCFLKNSIFLCFDVVLSYPSWDILISFMVLCKNMHTRENHIETRKFFFSLSFFFPPDFWAFRCHVSPA